MSHHQSGSLFKISCMGKMQDNNTDIQISIEVVTRLLPAFIHCSLFHSVLGL